MLAGDLDVGGTTTVTNLDVSGTQVSAVTALGTSTVIDCSQSNYFTVSVNSAITFSFTNVPASGAFGVILEINYLSGSIAWPASVYWPLDSAPAMAAGGTQLVALITSDGGTTWRGSALINFTN